MRLAMACAAWMFSVAAVSPPGLAVSQPLPACPPLPRPERVDARDVLAHPDVKAALEQVDELFENASRTIPSGFVATI